MKVSIAGFFASRRGIVFSGGIIGLLAGILPILGNPPNMGVCVACFERDIAGALGLHRTEVVQYLRPEIPGFVLGAMAAAIFFGEFRARGGSQPLVRFVLGGFSMIGALTFLGCPWRALLRLAGGDLNAVLGLVGLTAGIAAGCWFLKRGYTLGRSWKTPKASGFLMPALMLGLMFLVFIKPTFLFESTKGPGAMHASVWISSAVGLLVGFVAQRSRFCTMGSIRDAVLLKDFHLLYGVGAMIVATLSANLALGRIEPGFTLQPVAHSNHIWNFLGMVLAGLAFILAGGCPGRQLFLSGEGDQDAAIFVMGMITGAAFAHNFTLAAVPDSLSSGVLQTGGPGLFGQIGVIIGLVFCVMVGATMRQRT